MKTLNLYAGRNLNNTPHRRERAWLSGYSAFRPSACASKIILHTNKLALQTKSNLVRKISLLAHTLGLKAEQARTSRDDKVPCIQNPIITQMLAKLLKHLPNPKLGKIRTIFLYGRVM